MLVNLFNGRNRELDVLRGIAILLAMGWHVNGTTVDSKIATILMFPGKEFGWIGVDLFFVLSGFLVGGMIIKEVDRRKAFDIRTFYVRRIFRLWPVLYTFLIAMALVKPNDLATFFPQIALHVQNYWHTDVAVHLWSLAVEEHFYVLLSALIYFLISNKKKIGWLPYWMAGLTVTSFLFRIVGALYGDESRDLQGQTHYRLDGLCIGVIMAYYSHHNYSIISKIQKQKLVLWLLLIITIIFVSIVPKSSFLGSTVGYLIAAIGSAVALLLMYKSDIGTRLPLLCHVLAYIGIISYPLYLWHVPVARVIESQFTNCLPPLLLVLSIYFTSILVSSAFTILLEKPFMRIRDKMFPALAHPSVDVDLPQERRREN